MPSWTFDATNVQLSSPRLTITCYGDSAATNDLTSRAGELIAQPLREQILSELSITPSLQKLQRLRKLAAGTKAELASMTTMIESLESQRQQAIAAGHPVAEFEQQLAGQRNQRVLVEARLQDIEKAMEPTYREARDALRSLGGRIRSFEALTRRQQELIAAANGALAPLLHELALIHAALNLAQRPSFVHEATRTLLDESPAEVRRREAQSDLVPGPGGGLIPRHELERFQAIANLS
jgi:hypothetical protein